MSENETSAPVPLIRFIGDCGPLFGALAKAQAAFGVAKKTAMNPHFQKPYAPLEEIIEATKVALGANELCVIQQFSGGAGEYDFVTTLAHSSGGRIESMVSFAAGDVQKLGGAITYLKRYSRAAILGVATEDDDGNEAAQQPQAKAPPRSQPTPPAPKPQPRKPDAPKVPPVDPQMQADIDRRKVTLAQANTIVNEAIAASGDDKSSPQLEAAREVLAETEATVGVEPAAPAAEPSWATLADGHVPDAVSMPKGNPTGALIQELLKLRGFGFEGNEAIAKTLGFIAKHTDGGNPQVKPLTYGQGRSVIRALEAMS